MVRGRFAPSPSGRMHLGNALSALLAWLSVRSQGGEMVLRIEDLDRARCRREYAEQLADDLRWLGLDWDVGGVFAPYMQSGRDGFYQKTLDSIAQKARVYPCYCTRAELHAASAPHGSDGTPIYDGRCKNIAIVPDREPAWRVEVPDRNIIFADGLRGEHAENLVRDCGDFILRRSDGVFAYQLAVVADDADMDITEVVRGADLLGSTARQIWLFELLGVVPPNYTHIPLLTAPDGRRLSKRDGDLSFEALRKSQTPEQVVGTLAALAGLIDKRETVSATELIGHFTWKNVEKENIIATI